MRIKEAALATGLTERAIRLYEQHGLISPVITDKNGRDFRDYTDADVTKLKTVAALRRALFTIDEIKTMDASPDTIPEILSAHRKRMHIDFQNLSYLVDHIDRVDGDAVSSAEELASAIFSPAVISPSQAEPTEEEKILFSEQYERIYDKYFAENTGWDRRYTASLRVRGFFARMNIGKPAKIIGIALAAAFLFFFICFGIADVTKVDLTLNGTAYRIGSEEVTESADIRIEGRYKNYIFRDDQFEGIIFIDGYVDEISDEPFRRGFVVSKKSCRETRFAVSSTEISASLYAEAVHMSRARTEDGDNCAIRVAASFDEDFTLTAVSVLVYPQSPGNPGSYTWNDEVRVILASVGDTEDARSLLEHYTD